MGATNHTTNYNLSQFIGTDKPSWLNDYNGDMGLIDSAIKSAADDASAASTLATNASSTAASAANTANAVSTQINAPVTGIAAVVTEHTTDITNINTTIGNTPLDTTAQTLTGAVNELKADIPSTTGMLKYLGVQEISVAYDGVKTIATAMQEAYTAFVTAFSNLTATQKIRICDANPATGTFGYAPCQNAMTLTDTIPSDISFGVVSMGTNVFFRTYSFGATSWARSAQGTFTPTDNSATVPTTGTASIRYELYEVMT